MPLPDAPAFRRGLFPDHPDRAAAQDEIHARPIVPVSAPARVRRVVFLLGREPEAGRAAALRFEHWCSGTGRSAPADGARRVAYRAGPRQAVRELHNEFVTFTWLCAADYGEPWPEGISLEIEAGAASGMGLAMRIDVVEGNDIPEREVAGFDPRHLCRSVIEGGHAEVATDFTLDREGYTRFELASGSLGPVLTGIVVRRLLEIETYRVLALVGLPLARTVSPAMGVLETRLTGILAEIGVASTTANNQAALTRLHPLQIEAETLSHETRYRFSASRAYGRILARRLDSLGETASGEFRTLKRYLTHRLDPALWSIEGVAKRQEAVDEQVGHTTSMLNARIGLDVQSQTQTILAAMSETSQRQYRLQTTVEGLSTIAISYYALGIVGTVMKGVYEGNDHQTAIILALVALVVMAVTWLAMRRLHRRHRPNPGDTAGMNPSVC